jgi:undecaprenyl-diphosphatase
VVYGILQGVFAYIPVSSDAQIRLFQVLAGWQGDENPVFVAFTAVIQLGPTLAVILFLRKELAQALRGLADAVTGKNKESREAKLGMGVLWGTIPIVILGLILQKRIETDFRNLYVIAISLIVGAVIMYFADKSQNEIRTESDVQVKDGIFVGLWQCLALIPGMSRSGSTISGALFQKFKRQDATRFAFLLGIPSFTAAGVHELIKYRHDLASIKVPLLVAFVISFVVAYGCLAWFLQYLQKRGFMPFILYRIVIGVVILGLVFTKVVQPGPHAATQLSIRPAQQSDVP